MFISEILGCLPGNVKVTFFAASLFSGRELTIEVAVQDKSVRMERFANYKAFLG
jgi:hypothetical protein